jgi:hypothetical protein
MKIKLITTVHFDGVPYPAGSVIDPDAIGMNGDAAIHWMWAEPVDDDAPVAIVPIFKLEPVELPAEAMAESEPIADEAMAEPESVADEAMDEPEPVSPPKRKTKKPS